MTLCNELQFKQASEYELGQQLKLEEVFKVGDLVDVAGTSIGKGFQGIPCLPVHQQTYFLLYCSSKSGASAHQEGRVIDMRINTIVSNTHGWRMLNIH